MNKKLLFLIATFFTINGYSQISYEKGYFIDNTDQKIDCLIKNIDWRNNPIDFEYKVSENSESVKMNIEEVKEFEIHNTSKYVRQTVKIDKSIENLNQLSYEKNSVFEEAQIFLNVLVEGKANLYLYEEGNLKRYFYNIENSKIEQLVYKVYRISQSKIGKNHQYKQQLLNDLKCSSIGMNRIENVDYKKNSLVNFFADYNHCSNSEFVNFEAKQKKDLFNLTIRPRVNNSSLTIENPESNSNKIDFGNKTSFGIGIETEFILPFNKNKWAITIEPTYQKFKSETTTNTNNISGGILTTKVDYSSIELPFSLRHYFFLNKNSKIFLNISYVYDVSSKSSIKSTREDNSEFSSLEIKSQNNVAFGIGYKIYDKFGVEMRYQTNREILANSTSKRSNYKTVSIIMGYSIF